MIPDAHRTSGWMMLCLVVLVLVCQTARRVDGHPSRSTSLPADNERLSSTRRPQRDDDATSSSSISELIEAAYNNRELLRQEQWLQREDDDEDPTTTESMRSHSTGIHSTPRYEKRKLLQAVNADMSMQSDEKIVFPTDSRVSTMMSPTTPTMSPLACQTDTFCENVVGYPKNLVNAAIARNASLRFLQSVDPMPDIEQRIDTTDESPLCPLREQVVFPQTAQNKDKQWLFVVNQDNLKQGIRIEICMKDGQECNMIQGFAEGYRTSCKQKFIYRELAAVNSDGKIFKDQFRFPSSCCCHVKFVGDPNVRFGLRLDLRANRTTSTAPRMRRRK